MLFYVKDLIKLQSNLEELFLFCEISADNTLFLEISWETRIGKLLFCHKTFFNIFCSNKKPSTIIYNPIPSLKCISMNIVI